MKTAIIALLLILPGLFLNAQVSVSEGNGLPDQSAALDVNFLNKGFLLPRLTKAQRDAIVDPAEGLMVICTDWGTSASYELSIYINGYWRILYYCSAPGVPATGTNAAEPEQITWNWSAMAGTAGYRWGPTDNFSVANDVGANTSFTETGLTCSTEYTRYIWAYNNCGHSAAAVNTQATSGCVVFPVVTTAAITNIAAITATGGGNVTSDGGGEIFARGICWSTSSNPTIAGSHTTDGNGTGVFYSSLTGLIPNTLYYVRAYATNFAGTAYGEEVFFTTVSIAIGQAYGGGIIFYLDGTGQHGLIAAASDQSNAAPWGCYLTYIGTSTSIGTGQANTTAIVNGCATAGIAARICDDLVLNGYSDWFLPSKDELNQMYLQKNVIGGFAGTYYWSSSEYSVEIAMVQLFSNGTQSHYLKYDNAAHVRAVRSF